MVSFCLTGSGSKIQTYEKGEASRSGLMVLSTKACGSRAKPMGLEDLSTRMETCTRVSGRMTRLMVRAFTLISMERGTKVGGRKIGRTAKESKHGLMGLNTKEITKRARSMVWEPSSGLMAAPTKDSSLTTT